VIMRVEAAFHRLETLSLRLNRQAPTSGRYDWEHRRGPREQVEAGRRLAGHAFRGMLLTGAERQFLPGDNGDSRAARSILRGTVKYGQATGISPVRMGFVRYYGKVFRAAFTHSLNTAQSVIFALAIVIGAIAYFIPKTQAILMPWASVLNGWQVATGVLGTIVFVRLGLAPYWMFIQQSRRIDDLTQRVSIPDLTIDARRVPEIFANLPTISLSSWHRLTKCSGPSSRLEVA
jgi:hypothetical protein